MIPHPLAPLYFRQMLKKSQNFCTKNAAAKSKLGKNQDIQKQNVKCGSLLIVSYYENVYVGQPTNSVATLSTPKPSKSIEVVFGSTANSLKNPKKCIAKIPWTNL